jgi:hypothetical protein
MSDSSPPSSNLLAALRGRSTRIAWIVFLAVCIITGFLKNCQNEHFRAQSNARDQEEQRVARQERAKFDLFMNRHPIKWTIADFEKQLNNGRPLELRPNPKWSKTRIATWSGSPWDSGWELEFDDNDRLVRWSSGENRKSRDTQAAPISNATFHDRGEQFRQTIAKYGPWVWLYLLWSWILLWFARFYVSHALLMVAVPTAMAFLVSPYFSLSEVVRIDFLFLGITMILVSLATVARASSRVESAVATVFLPKRFGLRWMLAAMALIALVVRLGFYGVAMSIAIVAAAIWYRLMSKILAKKIEEVQEGNYGHSVT